MTERAGLAAWLLGGLALLLAGCGATTTPTEQTPPPPDDAQIDPSDDPRFEHIPGRPPNARERTAIAALLEIAERVRELSFAEPVPFRIQSREVITQFVRDQMEPEELERSRVFYVALGLIDPDIDVAELLVSVLGEQIVGYYDPDEHLMVLREDVAAELRPERSSRELGEAETVIVHELVHALQDQRLGLGTRYSDERTIDEDNAFASVVEGDATLAMYGYQAQQQGMPLTALTRNPGLLRMAVSAITSQSAGTEMDAAPPIVRLPLLSRYLDGMLFCATLHSGDAWPGVNSAHEHGPTSTEQVLHPLRFIAGEQPERFELPELPELTAAGLTVHDEDTLGELEMSIWFGLGTADEREPSAAEGWGGDRLRVYTDAEGRGSVVWFTTWDDEGEAIEAESGANRVRAAAPAEQQARNVVERIGRAVLIVRGLPPALHTPVRTAFASFAAGYPSAPPQPEAERAPERPRPPL